MSPQQPATSQKSDGRLSARLTTIVTVLVPFLKQTFVGIKSAWDRFWFQPGDPHTLGVMRWFVAGMLLYTHIVWGLNLEAFFGSSGWNSPELLTVLQEGQMVPSFWWYVPDAWIMPVHLACLFILFCFWIGLFTRVTSVLSMVITVSYCYRAHMANFGLDQINAILCFYLCIGPSGAVLSADRLLKVWREKRRSRCRETTFVPPPVLPSPSANLAVRLIQVHFCLIYAVAGLSKLQGPAWWSGEAVWLAFANLEYQSLDMTWVAWYPWIGELMTHSTIIWEVSFAALIWVRPVRPIVLFVGFLMHLGIGGVMGMWTFGLIMIFGHIAFWPQETIHRIAALFPSSERLLGVARAAAADGEQTAPESAAESGLVRRLKPALLYVDRTWCRHVDTISYFLSRGFRCMATDDVADAHQVCEQTTPDAVVVFGVDMDDDEIEGFHSQHCEAHRPQPLFMVLTDDQSERLNGSIRNDNSYVLSGKVSLGLLRREIQAALEEPAGMTVSDGDMSSTTSVSGAVGR